MLSLSVGVDLTEEEYDAAGVAVYWYRNGTLLTQNLTFEEGPFNCTTTEFGFG